MSNSDETVNHMLYRAAASVSGKVYVTDLNVTLFRLEIRSCILLQVLEVVSSPRVP